MACCFSGEPLRADELRGKRGAQMAKYANNRETFQIRMCDAPCKAPSCCLLGCMPCTFLCTAHHMRYKTLNHVAPGSGWDNYICCQGYCPAVCCFRPGHCCEKDLPRTCMCCEAFCCPGLAMSASRFVLMDQYALTPDECDNRLVRFNNCIQVLSCICHMGAMVFSELREVACIIDIIADIVFFTTAGCMSAQTNYEIEYRKALGGPSALPTAVAQPYSAPSAPNYAASNYGPGLGAPSAPELADGLPTKAEEPMDR